MIKEVWQQFLSLISQEVGSRVVETWFKVITLHHWDKDSDVVYLEAPNQFVRDWVQSNYLSILEIHLARLLHVQTLRVIIQVQGSTATQLIPASLNPVFIPAKKEKIVPKYDTKKLWQLKEHYVFDTFVVGPNNSLAYAAANAVAQKPGSVYNPLFMYGHSGVGKTHLLHAIGNEARKFHPTIEVLYQPADRFVSEFVNAIRFDKINKFQQKYQAIDLLLIDDIQCISNKEQTQEAFFCIFNALYDAQKQIVFSSDTYPQHMSGIAERLRSRMAWGLVTDMYVPSLETRMAILKKKAEYVHNFVLSDEVAHYIASCVHSNVRELEGALIRVVAFVLLSKQSITVEIARHVLGPTYQDTTKEVVTFASIIDAMYQTYKYDRAALCSKSRNKELVQARHVAMYLMKKMTNKSLREIGTFLGDRDHATVKHGVEKIETELEANHDLQQKLRAVEAVFYT